MATRLLQFISIHKRGYYYAEEEGDHDEGEKFLRTRTTWYLRA